MEFDRSCLVAFFLHFLLDVSFHFLVGGVQSVVVMAIFFGSFNSARADFISAQKVFGIITLPFDNVMMLQKQIMRKTEVFSISCNIILSK